LNSKSFTKPYPCSIQSLKTCDGRPVAFETETRPETFETETRKNGSRDGSRDSITDRSTAYLRNTNKLETRSVNMD